MDNDHANVNAQGALQVLETLRIRAEAKEVDHYESERPGSFMPTSIIISLLRRHRSRDVR
jgi:hypothetical protein